MRAGWGSATGSTHTGGLGQRRSAGLLSGAMRARTVWVRDEGRGGLLPTIPLLRCMPGALGPDSG